MLEIYCKEFRDSQFKKISEFHPGSWIYAKEANLEDLSKIAEATKIDISDIRDSLDK